MVTLVGRQSNRARSAAGSGIERAPALRSIEGLHVEPTRSPGSPLRRGLMPRELVRSGLLIALLATVGAVPSRAQSNDAAAAARETKTSLSEPRKWLPRDETLRFKVEVSVGPVRSLDVGSVRLLCTQALEEKAGAEDAAASLVERPRLVASIDGLAKGVYLGREVNHSIGVRWYEGTHPRIDYRENLRGSRSSARELHIGEFDGTWKLEFRKDRHCKGCKDRAHYTKGIMPWSSYSHCDDCDVPEHRVWREYVYRDVPPEAVDILSALYYARSFLRGTSDSTTLGLVNHDKLWNVTLRRGARRKIDTPAGEFDCVSVLIGPQLAAGDKPGEQANARFEALFGLHGDISVWVDRARGFPVMIEGTAPIGPFDVHVKASLTSHEGG